MKEPLRHVQSQHGHFTLLTPHACQTTHSAECDFLGVRLRPAALAVVFGLGLVEVAHGATLTVSATCTLPNAIQSVNAGAIRADVWGPEQWLRRERHHSPAGLGVLASRTPFIEKNVVIEGQTGAAAGAVVDGANTYRPFFVAAIRRRLTSPCAT